jgi:predicted RecB family endonuclease
LKPDYDDISTHLKLEKRKRIIAEIDVVARRGEQLHLFEVKCSYRLVKAKKQLLKAKKIFSNYNTTCYFYCGAGNQLLEVC